MLRFTLLLFFVLLPSGPPAVSALGDTPAYTADGKLQFPEHYREWVFLTSGVDMSYDPPAQPADHTMFDNVFVNPSAYRAFLQTGTWPDKTVMVLENRAGEALRSINTRGRTQSPELMGLELHVKDSSGPQSKLPGGWGFFSFNGAKTATLTSRPASCYTCHEAHAAVDTTFVQFYPTLLPLAQSRKTLSAAYLKELPSPTAR